MKVTVLTSLFPSPPRPFEGVFAERRWQGMRERGHDVRVVVPVPLTPPFATLGKGHWSALAQMPKHENRNGLPITRPRYLHLPSRALGNAKRFAKTGVQTILADQHPEVVVCDYAWPAAAACSALATHNIPCVINGRGSDVLQVAGEAGLGEPLAAGLRSAGHWCAVSTDLVTAMDSLANTGHGTLVPNGVDTALFYPRPKNAARAELGIATDKPIILVAGHLIPRKDPLLALSVFENGAPNDAICVFVGRGELRDALEQAARDRGLFERIRLIGEVTPQQIALWYAACDALLLTSHREGRPNVVLEVLASGRPVIASNVGGTGELLAPWTQQMLAPALAAEPMGAMLTALLDDLPDPDSLAASVSHLTWDASFATLEDVLMRSCQALTR